MRRSRFAKFYALASFAITECLPSALYAQQTITGQAAFADYTQQEPGIRRKITVADLPEPKPSESVDNGPTLVQRPNGAWPIAPAGFTVQLYAGGDAATPLQRSENKKETHPPTSGTFVMPRIIHAAPNGDLFVADSQAGSLLVLRGVTDAGKATTISTYAAGLDHPFGIAFYPAGANLQWIYVGNATTVVRFAYKSGNLKATRAPETIVPDLPGYAQLRGGGHWTRDVVFSADDKAYASVKHLWELPVEKKELVIWKLPSFASPQPSAPQSIRPMSCLRSLFLEANQSKDFARANLKGRQQTSTIRV